MTATTDKLFLLSYSEIVPTSYWASSYPWTSSEGSQYEAFKGKVTNNDNTNSAIAIGDRWWERSVTPDYSTAFLNVLGNGNPTSCDSRDVLALRLPRLVLLGTCSSSLSSERPALSCAGLSFGD